VVKRPVPRPIGELDHRHRVARPARVRLLPGGVGSGFEVRFGMFFNE
jgi:hypothetical protein